MSIAAEDGVAPSTVPDAAARVLLFTQVARPADLPLILNALSPAELNAGIVRLGPDLPQAVIDHVVEHGPRAARTTLAWQLRLPPPRPAVRPVLQSAYDRMREERTPGQNVKPGHDIARRRLLSRAEPDIDRALFGRLEQVGIAWVRSAILRDRVGPDGEPIVPPGLRAELAGFVGTASLPLAPSHLADTDTGDPEFELLRVLAGARDLGLSLPASRVLGLPGPIRHTEPGWRDQAWVQRWDRPGAGSRSWRLDWDEVLHLAADHDAVAGGRGRFLGRVAGLDEAAAREDVPEDVRRQLLAGYPQAAWHTGAPDVATLRRIAAAVPALRGRWGSFEQEPEFRSAVKELLIRGLALGSLTAAEVIEHAVPAAAVLDLAWRSADAILPAARGRADLAGELGALLDRRLGADVPLWSALLMRSCLWTGTVAELVDSTAVLGPRQAIPGQDEIDAALLDGPSLNVLLTFARPPVSRELLAGGPAGLDELEPDLLEGCPLPPVLVARALAAGAGHDGRRILAGNPVTPVAVLQRLLEDTVAPAETRLALLTDAPDPAIGYAALELLERSGVSWAQIMHFVKNLGEARVYQLAAAAPNAERLHFLLKKFGRYLGPDTSALLYGRLAAEAGPEPVWDAATTVAGAIGEVGPFVRASMASGDSAPLLKGAEIASLRHLPGVTAPDPREQAPAPHPDDPARWQLETAVRQHLDNRPHRWRIMVRRLMAAGPLEYAQLADLVETIEWTTGPADPDESVDPDESAGSLGERAGEAVEGEP